MRTLIINKKCNYKDDAQLKEALIKKDANAIQYVFFGDFNVNKNNGGFRLLLNKNAKLTGHREDTIADLIHDLYIHLYENDCERLKKYDSSMPFVVWLSVVSYRYFKNIEKSYREKTELVGDDTILNKVANEPSKEIISDIEKIFDKLPPPKNEMMKDLIIYKDSPAEVSARYNRTIEWVYLMKSRALKELRAQLIDLLFYQPKLTK